LISNDLSQDVDSKDKTFLNKCCSRSNALHISDLKAKKKRRHNNEKLIGELQ
jgi:hypothetical protein